MNSIKLLAALIVVAGIVTVAAVLFLHDRKTKNAARQFKSTDEFIQYLAAEAVKDAQRENHIQLDYSTASIEQAEKILGTLHEQYVKDPSSLNAPALANMYGAYIGESIRRSEPGATWERDHPVFGEKTYPLHWAAGDSFPMAWCYHRITDGAGDNVWIKYLALKQRASEKKTSTTR